MGEMQVLIQYQELTSPHFYHQGHDRHKLVAEGLPSISNLTLDLKGKQEDPELIKFKNNIQNCVSRKGNIIVF